LFTSRSHVGLHDCCVKHHTGDSFINILSSNFKYKSAFLGISSNTVWLLKKWQKNISAKAACKIMLKLTTGDNFINIFMLNFFHIKVLCAAFLQIQFGFKKWQNNISTKAACKIMLKLTTGDNFINILRSTFSYKSALRNIYINTVWL